MTIIQATALTKRFGGMTAVDGTTLAIAPQSIVGLIGPNGSGKTTTLNLLNGALRPDGGTIEVAGQNLAGRSSDAFVKAGVTRTFQTPRVFSTITALENLLVPVLHTRGRRSRWHEKAEGLLEFVGLLAHRDTPASELSGGQQKLLEFVRALMTDPAIVLMDEPFAGVHPSVKEVMRDRIVERNREGTAFLIVSHEIPDLTRLCSQVICMSEGKVIAEGAPDEVTSPRPSVTPRCCDRRGRPGRGDQRSPRHRGLPGPRPRSPRRTRMTAPVLAMHGVTAGYFANDIVLDEVDIRVEPGKVTVVLGPNGSGKSTSLRVLSGFLSPRSGTVTLGDEDITALNPGQRLGKGVALLPQGRSVFPQLSVEDNLRLGAWQLRHDRAALQDAVDRAIQRYPVLDKLRTRAAGSLSGGQARILEFARTLILDPQVLLIDEPSVGLAPVLVDEVYDELDRLKEEGRTILLVDQNVQAAVGLADYVYTLAYGRNHLEGARDGFEGQLDELIKQWLKL